MWGYEPIAKSAARDEGYIPNDIHALCIQTNHHTLDCEWYAAGILNHRHAIPESKVLIMESIRCMCGLQDGAAGYAFHDRLLNLRARLVFVQLIFNLLDFGDSFLKDKVKISR